jgi:hypothetical protein
MDECDADCRPITMKNQEGNGQFCIDCKIIDEGLYRSCKRILCHQNHGLLHQEMKGSSALDPKALEKQTCIHPQKSTI